MGWRTTWSDLLFNEITVKEASVILASSSRICWKKSPTHFCKWI